MLLSPSITKASDVGARAGRLALFRLPVWSCAAGVSDIAKGQ